MPACASCSVEKPESEFYRYYSRRGCPLNNRCKDCCRAATRAYDLAHPKPTTRTAPSKLYGSEVNPIASMFLKLKRPASA